ncbi:hypothetical protein JW935_00235 [candidate division KSB1 bacterium]|nr:hypothetical protein [candidate division KSB1 bacterium]
MKFRLLLKLLYAVILFLLFTHPVWCQDSGQPEKQKKSAPPRLMLQLGDQDVILPITSIEWGIPDRWSFTSRYVHLFEKERDDKTWLNVCSISLCPGTAGGRFGISYLGLLSPKSMRDFALITETRMVLLRTWGNPLTALPNHTYAGAELRMSIGWLNLCFGYYSDAPVSGNGRDKLYGFHFGLGI